MIDLSVDELETEESILLYACHNSIENVGSPVAPTFSPVTQILTGKLIIMVYVLVVLFLSTALSIF